MLDAFGELGGRATAFQIVEQVKIRFPDIDSNTLTPRLKPLERKGLIVKTGEKGPGRGGAKRQMMWRLVSLA